MAHSFEPAQSEYQKQWTDETCKSIGDLSYFPAQVLNPDVQKNIIKRFFNFYLGGKVKVHSVIDLIFSVISIMPLHVCTEETPWKKEEYRSDGTLFSLLPVEDIQLTDRYRTVASSTSSSQEQSSLCQDNKTKDKQGIDVSKTEIVPVQNDEKQSAIELNMKYNENKSEIINNNQLVELMKKNKNFKQEQESREDKIKTCEQGDEIELIKSSVESDEKISGNSDKQEKLEHKTEPKNIIESKSLVKCEIRYEYEDSSNKTYFEREQNNSVNEEENETIKISEFMKWSSFNGGQDTKNSFLSYGPVENAAFIKSCHKLLHQWETDENAGKILKFFFGIVALTLMRSITKSLKHVLNIFHSNHFFKYIIYINNFCNFDFFENPDINYFPLNMFFLKFSVPDKNCIGTSYRAFRTNDENIHRKIRIMFAKIITYSIYIDDQIEQAHNIREVFSVSMKDPFTMNFFRSTILSHTADYGLELIGMVHTIVNRLNTDSINITIQVTYCKETAQSWRRVKKYIDEYLSHSSKNKTHYWARVIDEDYFKELSCTENYPLAVILTCFNEKITRNQGIWQAKWIKMVDNVIFETYKKLGQEMFQTFIKKNPFADFFLREIALVDQNNLNIDENYIREFVNHRLKMIHKVEKNRKQKNLQKTEGESSEPKLEFSQLVTREQAYDSYIQKTNSLIEQLEQWNNKSSPN